MGKLIDAAFDIFIREYKFNDQDVYSKFEDVVWAVDTLGQQLFLPNYLAPHSTKENSEIAMRYIPLIISKLIDFADHQKLDIEEPLSIILNEYRNRRITNMKAEE